MKFVLAIGLILAFLTSQGMADEQSDALKQAYDKGGVLYKAGRYSDALPYYQRALLLGKKVFGINHPTTSVFMSNLAGIYLAQEHYDAAKLLYKRALKIRERAFGENHPDVAASLNALGVVYYYQGNFEAVEPIYKRSIAIYENFSGKNHPSVSSPISNLAELYRIQGKFGASEGLYKRSLSIDEKAFGPDSLEVAIVLNNLAVLDIDRGRITSADLLFKRSIAIKEKSLGNNHPSIGLALNNFATLQVAQGNYSLAENLYKRSIAILEKTLGPNHSQVSLVLNDLSQIYGIQARYNISEQLLKRALFIQEKTHGVNNPKTAIMLNNLADLYVKQGKYRAAEDIFRRSLTIFKKAFGSDHVKVALLLNNLADLYVKQGKYRAAEGFFKRSLKIDEKVLGGNHPDTARDLNNLSELYKAQGRYSAARTLRLRSLAVMKIALGPKHPQYAQGLNNLAALYNDQGKFLEALVPIRQASIIYRERGLNRDRHLSIGGVREQKRFSFVFFNHISILWDVARLKPTQKEALSAEAFEAGQLARISSVADALASMSVRFAAKNDNLAQLVRNGQDATAFLRKLDKKLIETISLPKEQRNNKSFTRIRNDISEVDLKIKRLNYRLRKEFPKYSELTNPSPIKLKTIQMFLAPSEAMLFYLVGERYTFLWVVRRDRSRMYRFDIGAKQLSDTVKKLRGGLDLTGVNNSSEIPPFDIKLAHNLYNMLFAPAKPMLEGANSIFVVPDGALQSLPMSVLVVEKPTSTMNDFRNYRKVAWLSKDYALSTLPSVSSLLALRNSAKNSNAKEPFLGIGDPLLNGHPDKKRGVKLASLFAGRGISNVSAVRNLTPLPDTANELLAMAMYTRAGTKNLMLREKATERILRSINLTKYKTLAFATHALVAGDLTGLAEPALVLTPPKVGSEEDDGLLTASEVASLKLDADWVILSACNTAATDGTLGAEGFSGLTKAFFYAGTRALLVSHWPVDSDAAVHLTTVMLEQSTNNPTIGRAEALRRSMLALITNDNVPSHYAHPMFWAPFVVVGEGGVPPQ